MASISRAASNGRRRIQFVACDGKRKTIRLPGKYSKHQAENTLVKVEQLRAAQSSSFTVDNETLQWLDSIKDDLHAKLVAVGLVAARRSATGSTLGEWLQEYRRHRADVSRGTSTNYGIIANCKIRCSKPPNFARNHRKAKKAICRIVRNCETLRLVASPCQIKG